MSTYNQSRNQVFIRNDQEFVDKSVDPDWVNSGRNGFLFKTSNKEKVPLLSGRQDAWRRTSHHPGIFILTENDGSNDVPSWCFEQNNARGDNGIFSTCLP